MQQLEVETGQNVLIHKEIANVGERIAAQLIDYAVILAYLITLSLIADLFNNQSDKDIFTILILIPVFFYSPLSEAFLQGQSLGKKALKIKVVKISGAQPSFGSYIIRWLFKVIEGNIALFGSPAIITIAANGKGQRLGDLVAKTSVISLKRKESLENTIYVEIPKEYSLIYPETEKLQLSDIKTVKDVIKHYKKHIRNESAIKMLKDTAAAVKRKTGIIGSEVPLKFLENILADYNCLHKTKKK